MKCVFDVLGVRLDTIQGAEGPLVTAVAEAVRSAFELPDPASREGRRAAKASSSATKKAVRRRKEPSVTARSLAEATLETVCAAPGCGRGWTVIAGCDMSVLLRSLRKDLGWKFLVNAGSGSIALVVCKCDSLRGPELGPASSTVSAELLPVDDVSGDSAALKRDLYEEMRVALSGPAVGEGVTTVDPEMGVARAVLSRVSLTRGGGWHGAVAPLREEGAQHSLHVVSDGALLPGPVDATVRLPSGEEFCLWLWKAADAPEAAATAAAGLVSSAPSMLRHAGTAIALAATLLAVLVWGLCRLEWMHDSVCDSTTGFGFISTRTISLGGAGLLILLGAYQRLFGASVDKARRKA
jgi:hypothetical protein